MKPLAKCAHGCNKPPKPPSKVLCEDCLEKVSASFDIMIKKMAEKARKL